MRASDIHSTTWEWDFLTRSCAWQHARNDLHHLWTNLWARTTASDPTCSGWTLAAVEARQPGQPLYDALPAPLFEWGIAVYDLELTEYKRARSPKEAFLKDLSALGHKALKQFTKGYAATPAVVKRPPLNPSASFNSDGRFRFRRRSGTGRSFPAPAQRNARGRGARHRGMLLLPSGVPAGRCSRL
jgi:hypothetical protein